MSQKYIVWPAGTPGTPVAQPDAEAGVEPDAAPFAQLVIWPCQTHTCRVGVIEAGPGPIPSLADTDALVCFRRRLAVGVRTADCVPVLLYAPDIKAVAAVHAGWRGSLGGIVDNAVGIMVSRGADPALMLAAMGPCICGDCYEVSPDLAALFAREGMDECITAPDGQGNAPGCNPHLDLPMVNRLRMLRLGLRGENIAMPQTCTMEAPELPSWRRSPGIATRLLTWIRLK